MANEYPSSEGIVAAVIKRLCEHQPLLCRQISKILKDLGVVPETLDHDNQGRASRPSCKEVSSSVEP